VQSLQIGIFDSLYINKLISAKPPETLNKNEC